MVSETRELLDLISVGPAMVRDFHLLGVHSVADLARRSPERMYAQLERVGPQHVDICVLDTFRAAAVAQARNPRLPAEQCQWWWWSARRKKV